MLSDGVGSVDRNIGNGDAHFVRRVNVDDVVTSCRYGNEFEFRKLLNRCSA